MAFSWQQELFCLLAEKSFFAKIAITHCNAVCWLVLRSWRSTDQFPIPSVLETGAICLKLKAKNDQETCNLFFRIVSTVGRIMHLSDVSDGQKISVCDQIKTDHFKSLFESCHHVPNQITLAFSCYFTRMIRKSINFFRINSRRLRIFMLRR